MLSAHEIAALMVLGSLGYSRDIDRRDLAALAARNLIHITNTSVASTSACLTPTGYQVLSAVQRAFPGTARRGPYSPRGVSQSPSRSADHDRT